MYFICVMVQKMNYKKFIYLCCTYLNLVGNTDFGHPERKQPSLHGRKFNPNPNFLGAAEAYFVCHIGPIFQISLIYALIGCRQSVINTMFNLALVTLYELIGLY